MSNDASLEYKMLTPEETNPETKKILDDTLEKIGMIPNMYSVMANSPALLDSYVYSYNSFRNQSGFSPIEQEVLFLSISVENECKYCVSAHSFVADNMSHVPAEITDAIREGRNIPDERLQALSVLAKEVVAKRGLPGTSAVYNFLIAGYTQSQLLSVVLAVGIKTISNYLNHIAETPVDKVFGARLWEKA